MKQNLAVCVLVISLIGAGLSRSSASYAASGRGVITMAVQVTDRKDGEPIEGVSVSLLDAGVDELRNDPKLKRYLPLFAPTQTNLIGRTFVHSFGGFHDVDGARSEQVRGRLIAKKKGYRDVEIELTGFLGKSLETKPFKIHEIPVAMDRL